MASEQRQLHGILGEQALRPSTHCVTLQGQAASDSPSSCPSSQLFLSSLTALGCPSSLGSGGRMQTRQHKCLVLNPKRTPLWAPSRGNTALHAVHATGTKVWRMATVGEAGCLLGALCSILAPVWESCRRHGGKDTVAESYCCQETSQL